MARTKCWLALQDAVQRGCRSSNDALDAVIASLVARTAATGCCGPVPEEVKQASRREGWIALPISGNLEELATTKPR